MEQLGKRPMRLTLVVACGLALYCAYHTITGEGLLAPLLYGLLFLADIYLIHKMTLALSRKPPA